MNHLVVVQLILKSMTENHFIWPRPSWKGAVDPTDDSMLDARSNLPVRPWPIALVGVPSWAEILWFKDGTVHAIHYKRDDVQPVVIASFI